MILSINVGACICHHIIHKNKSDHNSTWHCLKYMHECVHVVCDVHLPHGEGELSL